jgi:hypothetical protein
MSDLMDRLLREKDARRRRLANLPIEEKLRLMERTRDRARLIAANPLRTRHICQSKVAQIRPERFGWAQDFASAEDDRAFSY